MVRASGCAALLVAGLSLAASCLADAPIRLRDAEANEAAGILTVAQAGDTGGGTEHTSDNERRHLREAAKLRVEFDNDVAFGSDNQFSNGWSVQVHTAVADSWQGIEGPAEPMKNIGAWLPTLTGDGLKYRMNLGVGQIMQTPNDLEEPDFIADDVPYAGILTMQATWLAFNDVDLRAVQVSAGVLGRPSLAEQTQNFVHEYTGSDIAEGWDNQLDDEFVFNVNYMRKKKFYKRDSFDAAVSGLVDLGTMFTLAEIRLETRFGKNMPGGFAYTPDPIGRAVAHDATLAPANPKASSVYGSFALGAAAVAHNVLIDGNVYKDGPDVEVEKEELVGLALFGFHYERENWGVHLDWVFTTDTVDTDTLAAGQDPENNFGSIMIEWRI